MSSSSWATKLFTFLVALVLFHGTAHAQSIPSLEANAANIERAKGANDEATILAKLSLASALTTEGDFDRAQALLNDLLVRAKTNARVTRALLVERGFLEYARHDVKAATATLEKVFAEAQQAKDDRTALRAALVLIQVTTDSGTMETVARHIADALQIARRAFGEESPELGEVLLQYARTMGHLASDNETEALGEAKAAALRSIAIAEKNASDITIELEVLAGIQRKLRDYAGAKVSLARSLRICRSKFSDVHPCVGNATFELERVALAEGNAKDGIAWAKEDESATERYFARGLDFGSEAQRSALMQNLTSRTYATLTVADRWPNEPGAREVALNTLLHRKGRVLDGIVEARRASPDLASARAALSRASLSGENAASITKLEANVEALEQSAYRGATKNRDPITPANVARALPKGSALVEIGHFATFISQAAAGENWGAGRYGAYVLRDDGSIIAVPLGAAEPIEKAADNLRKALSAHQEGNAANTSGRALDALVFAPLEPALGGVTRVFLSLDGALHTVPFEALVDPKNHYRVESYELTYLTSGRDLVVKTTAAPTSGAFVFASPDFDVRTSDGPALFGKRVHFDALPATKAEGTAVSSLLHGTLVSGEAATETSLKATRSPSVLHVASHGFFLSDRNVVTLRGSRGLVLEEAPPGLADHATTNPLLRAGIALAGANAGGKHTAVDDGVLTGIEVTDLDLRGTRLVVLSACETGVGEVRNGEGVFGLRRALALAGSRSQVLSLWKVDDDASMALMHAFYNEMNAGKTASAALRAAKLRMLADPKTSHPFFWAAFTASGVPVTLNGGGGGDSTGAGAEKNLEAKGCRCDTLGRADHNARYEPIAFVVGALVIFVRRKKKR